MAKTIKIIKLFYIVYTVYTLCILLISDYNLLYAVIGLLAIWINLFMLEFGYKTVGETSQENVILNKESHKAFLMIDYGSWPNWQLMLNSVVCAACTYLSTKFYTGKGLGAVISSMFGSGDAYYSYQNYFKNNNLGYFSLAKIPYILMLTYLTISLFWGIVGILQSSEKLTFARLAYIGSVLAEYMYFGIARGTNFELYICFIMVSYAIIMRSKSEIRINSKALLIAFVLGVIMVGVFRVVVSARGISFQHYICEEIQYDPSKPLSRLIPGLTSVLTSVFSYLGYGIYTIGVLYVSIIPGSLSAAFGTLYPYGYQLLCGESMSDSIRSTIELASRWIPDYAILLNLFGLPCFALLMFALGRFAASVRNSGLPHIFSDMFSVFIFVEMLSMPVGNFLTNSTPNELTVCYLLIAYLVFSRINLKFIWGKSING